MTTQDEKTARDRADEENVKFAASLTATVDKAAPLPRAAASADSSGFVDISAFSASDPKWVERALAKARGEAEAPKSAPPPRPIPTVRGMLLAPPTLAPVAIATLVEAREDALARAKARKRRPMQIVLASVAVSAAILGVATLKRPALTHVTTSFATASKAEALAFVLAMPSGDATSTSTPASTPASTSTSTPASSSTSQPLAAAKPASAQHPPLAAASPRAKPAPIPAAKSAGSPSLEEMMRRAAQSPPAKPKK